MARHDFSPQTVKLLAERVGFHCSNPACGVATIGPSVEPDKKEYVGVAAHIFSASIDKGPRANPLLSEKERKSINNGIHLCNKCSTLIDKNDGVGYPPELLFDWKRCAEEAARSRIYNPDPYILYKRVYFSHLEKRYSTALTCSGLGEKNVLSCPSNSILMNDILNKLKLSNKCIIRGDSGSGKSLLTYQVAKELHDHGWSVHKLEKSSVTETTLLVAPLKQSLILVDDAQILTSSAVENIINSAYDQLMVLINWNTSTSFDSDFLRNYPCIDIVPSLQVDILKKYCLANKKHLENLLNEIGVDIDPKDNRRRIEARIERASHERTPWLFNYSLTEGWHVAKSDIELLQSKEQLHLVLVVVAVYQYATLDNGVSEEVIIEALRNYNPDSCWLNRVRNTIKDYCVNTDGLIRNKHYEYSRRVLRVFASKQRPNNESSFVINLFRAILLNKLYKSGHANILEFLMFEYKYCQYVLNSDGIIQNIAAELFANDSLSASPTKVGKLNSLIRFNKEVLATLELNGNVLKNWILYCDRGNAYHLGNLVNTLYNEKYKSLIIDNDAIDTLLTKIISAKMEDKARFSYLISRIALFLDEDERVYAKDKLLSSNFTVDLSSYTAGVECYHFSYLINNLGAISLEWVGKTVEKNIDLIAFLMNKDLMETYKYLAELIGNYFGVYGRVLGVKHEEKESKRLAKLLSRKLSVEAIVSAFESIETIDVQNFTHILVFISMYERKKILEISEKINYKKLKTLYGNDKVIDHNHKNMLRILHNPNSKNYSAYVSDLINTNTYIDELLFVLNPALSLNKIKDGTPYKMKFHDCSECKITLDIVQFIKEDCKEVAWRVVSENANEIRTCIFSKSLNVDDKKEKYDFLVFLYQYYPDVLKGVFDNEIQINELLRKIYRLIKGKIQERNIARLYAFFIKKYAQGFRLELENLERRFPTIRRFSIE